MKNTYLTDSDFAFDNFIPYHLEYLNYEGGEKIESRYKELLESEKPYYCTANDLNDIQESLKLAINSINIINHDAYLYFVDKDVTPVFTSFTKPDNSKKHFLNLNINTSTLEIDPISGLNIKLDTASRTLFNK